MIKHSLKILLKQKSLNADRAGKRLFAALALFICFTNFGCGKRMVPLPPIERVAQRIQIDGFQRGAQVHLGWEMPARNVGEKNTLNINRIDVYRLAEPNDASLTLSEEEFSSKSTLIATLPVTDKDFGLKRFDFTDTLEFAGQSVRLRYAVRFVNAAGQKAAFSNFLLIEPNAKIADAPKSLAAEVVESSVNLQWAEPESNIDGSKPPNILGYNVYRSTATAEQSGAPKLLNETPIAKTKFSDKSFEFDLKYFYFVRSVSIGGDGNPVESLESNTVNVFGKDIFPPGAPTAITIAAAPNNLSIFFAFNPEKDIAGYKLYRSSDKSIPLSQWENITPELLKTNTFQDTKVEAGKTYYYYLQAVDRAGNVSQPSEIVSETAP